jgi:hypothetical protein
VEVPAVIGVGGNPALCGDSQGEIWVFGSEKGLDRGVEMGDDVSVQGFFGMVIKAKVSWANAPQIGMITQVGIGVFKIIGLESGNRWNDEELLHINGELIIPKIAGIIEIINTWPSFEMFLQYLQGVKCPMEESNE